MGLRLLIYIVLAAIVFIGLRSIIKDWRKKFAQDDADLDARKKARLERNRAEAKQADVVDLQRGDDGIYRPGADGESKQKERR